MNKLTQRLGIAGYAWMNYQNRNMWMPAGGTTEMPPGPLWFVQHFMLPTGGSLHWWNQFDAGGTTADKIAIYYIAQPDGGQIRFSVSTNGGPWITKLLLDGYHPTPVGRHTNISLIPAKYRARLDSEFGTNYVIGAQHFMSHTGGVVVAFSDFPGINLAQVTNVPLAIRNPILSGLKPDLIIWHMKEDNPLATSNRMEEVEQWWKDSAPETSVIYIGTPWMSLDLTSTVTPDQNAIVRNIAVRHGRAYADLMQPTVSYSWLADNFYIPDGTHLTSAGGFFCANIMWDDMGFFSLGLNKKISLTQAGPMLNLSYKTDAGAVYRLESSTNLQTWTAVLTNAPGNAMFSTNFPSSSVPTYFRLGLRPE